MRPPRSSVEPDRFDYTEPPAGVDSVDVDEVLEKTGLEVIGFDVVDE